jgi:DNA (cytosine-5)-methyltransferase 1
MPPRVRFIDLFAGIGGTRLGFEAAGAQCVFTVEIDAAAVKTYEANHGTVDARDVREVSGSDIPDYDILVAGFPCQPFSIAGVSKKNSLGKGHGFLDEISGTLFFEIARIVSETKPKAVFLENVKNLRTHDKGRTLSVILDTLHELGYETSHSVVDGANWVPQHRERTYIIATKRTLDKLGSFAFPVLKKRRKRVLKEILDPNIDTEKYTLSEKLWKYLKAYAAKHKAAGNGFGYGLAMPDGITRTLSARYYKDGSEILVYQGPGLRPRRLSPRECARLMGFPNSFRIVCADTPAYKQFGNSVVVPAVKSLAIPLVQRVAAAKRRKHLV